MKTIGLIGGISYQSSLDYYRLINQQTNQILGSQHSAKIVMVSLNFAEILQHLHDDKWDKITSIMLDAALQLEKIGVDFIAICCNTFHRVVPALEKTLKTPIFHILEATGQAIKQQNIKQIALFGTRFLMDGDYHQTYLLNKFQIDCIMPNYSQREIINKIIFKELCYGIVKQESKKDIINIIDSLQQQGAQGIILGCTELPMLLPLSSELKIPLFETTALHAMAITRMALDEVPCPFLTTTTPPTSPKETVN